MAKQTLSIAHWVANITEPVSSLDDWCRRVERILKMAARRKFDIVLMPEYISEHWMSFSPKTLAPAAELAWLASQAEKVIPRLQAAVRETGVTLLAGTMPWPLKAGRVVNRAWMLFPDRKAVFHDKLVLIPSEKSPKGWMIDTGDTVRVFKWRGFRMTILICLDIEMPALSHKMAHLDLDLILVPSMTEKASGYYRVFNCARARAVEFMSAVAVTGCIGGSMKNKEMRTRCSGGAAVYIPSEQVFGYTGVFADIPVHATHKGIGRILWAKDIPVGKIRDIRRGKPEVWPGPWSADKIRIVQA